MKTTATALMVCALAACTGTAPDVSEPPGVTQGQRGLVSFSYGSCLFGCALDRPMVVGASPVRMSVLGDRILTDMSLDMPTGGAIELGATRRATDGSGQETIDFDVRSATSGAALLSLRSADGTMYDAVMVEAEQMATMELALLDYPVLESIDDGGILTASVGDQLWIRPQIESASGRKLHYDGAVTITITSGRDLADVTDIEGAVIDIRQPGTIVVRAQALNGIVREFSIVAQ